MATHSSVLAWRIPGTGEPGGLPSMGSHRVGHDCNSSLHSEQRPRREGAPRMRSPSEERAVQSMQILRQGSLSSGIPAPFNRLP